MTMLESKLAATLSLQELKELPNKYALLGVKLGERLEELAQQQEKIKALLTPPQREMSQLTSQAQTVLHCVLQDLGVAMEGLDGKFLQRAQGLQEALKPCKQVLAQWSPMLQLCELPVLALTLTRTHQHPDAQLLLSHLARLYRRHPHLQLLKSLVGQAEQVQEEQKRRLLQQLRVKLSLASFLATVGHLRSTGRFSEKELVMAVFRARGGYVSNAWQENPLPQVNRKGLGEMQALVKRFRKAAELWRDRVYEVIRQLRAGFPSERALLSDLAIHLSFGMTEAFKEILAQLKGFSVNEDGTTGQLEGEVEERKEPTISSEMIISNVAMVHQQLNQMGMALCSIECECAAFLTPVFIDTVEALIIGDLNRALQRLSSSSSPLVVLSEITDEPGIEWTNLVLKQPLLARFTNQLLEALNALRLLAIVALAPRLARQFQRCFEQGWLLLLGVEEKEEALKRLWRLIERQIRSNFEKIYGKCGESPYWQQYWPPVPVQ